jgi:NADH-quinone oxidoreductase chain G
MVRLLINNRFFFVKKNISILEACKFIGIKIPRFCFHENLSIAGNCRMCLVETDKAPKPVAACAAPIMENLSIITKGPRVLKSRENVLETLLLNHPLDCPICDQGGECDLQDQAQIYGTRISRGYVNKRGVEDKYCGTLVKTIMNRCIHCTRCVRFGIEISGTYSLGTLNRGTNTEIGNYITKISNSPILSNVVDLCPVGALTLKTSAFVARPWELKSLETVDLTDGLGSNIYINYKELDVVKVSPKKNKELNESWISDKGRFAFDSLINHRIEAKSVLSYDIFKTTLSFLNNNENRTLFLINKELSLKELNLLKKLTFLSKNKLKVKLFSNEKKQSNFYLWGFNSKISKISTLNSKVCLFLSSNVEVEASLLNIRLRTKFLINEVNFFALGNFMRSTYSILFVRFGISEVVSLFGSKNKVISKLFLKTINPIIISGKSLNDRLDSNILDFFLKKNSSVLNYTIHTKSNEESVKYLNFDSYTNKNVAAAKNLYFLNLEDTLNLREITINSNKNSINFASHSSKLMEYASSTISVLVPQETGGVFLNLEKRPQLVTPLTIKKNWGIISFESFFSSLLEIFYQNLNNKIVDNRNNLEIVFNEILLNSKLFISSLSLLNLLNVCKNSSTINFNYNVYPFKLIIEDYLRTNNFTKYSTVLLNRSREIRKLENTFFI